MSAGRPPRARAARPSARARCRRSRAGRSRTRAAAPMWHERPRRAASRRSALRPAGQHPNRSHPSSERSPTRPPRPETADRPTEVPPPATHSYPSRVSISRTAPALPEAHAGEEQDAAAFLERAEVRDVLAWMCLLVDPKDAAAVVRALARPPIELRQVDLARVIALARRRKLDLVAGLSAATESPQIPPEACERIRRFVELHRSSMAELDTVPPDVFVGRLVERLGVRGRPLLAPEDAAEQRASLEQLRALAADFVRCEPGAGMRELTAHLAAMAQGAR